MLKLFMGSIFRGFSNFPWRIFSKRTPLSRDLPPGTYYVDDNGNFYVNDNGSYYTKD